MSTTSTDLVEETRRYLYAGQSDPLNKLNGDTSAIATTMSFVHELGAIQAGAYLSIGLEIVYVWSVQSTATKQVTVERGQLGTTPAGHADATVVHVNSKFPTFSILNAVNSELDALSSPDNGLFRPIQTTLSFQGAKYGYDLNGATAVLGPLEARMETPGPAKDWPRIAMWDIQRNSDLDDFPSGFAVVLKEEGFPGRDVRVTYAAPFERFTGLGQNIVEVTGLPATANDIPPLGAALRLQSVREGQRNFNESQGDTRRAAEVPAGAQLTGARGLQALWDRRVKEEARRLKRLYPQYRRVT